MLHIDTAKPDLHFMGVPVYFDKALGADSTVYIFQNNDKFYWFGDKGITEWKVFEDTFGMTDKEKEETHMSEGMIATQVNEIVRNIENRLRAEQERSIFDLMVYGRDPRNPFHHGAFARAEPKAVVAPGGTIVKDGVEYIVKGVKPKPVVKPPKKDYNTLGVRFIHGPNLEKVYTYKVKKGARLHLGQEIVVPTTRDGKTTNTVAIIVELHATPQDTMVLPNGYGWVAGTVKAL